MARINLLPWRDDLRKEKQTNFIIVMVIMLVLSGIAMSAVHYYYADRISAQNKRNAYLQKEIKKLDIEIAKIRTFEAEKKKLSKHLGIIQRLQSSRSEVVHMFDEAVRTLPEGVYLTSLKQNGNELVINGLAQSNARVSSYMWNIEKSKWLTNPRLNIISTSKSGRSRISKFTLRMTLNHNKAKDAEKKP